MVKRLTVIFVVCLFVLGIFSAGAFAAENYKAKPQLRKDMLFPGKGVMSTKPVDVYRSLGGKAPLVTCADIAPQAGIKIRHMSIDNTWLEPQTISPILRQMDITLNGFRNFAYLFRVLPPSDRTIRGQCYDPFTPYSSGGVYIDGSGQKPLATVHSSDHLQDGIPLVLYSIGDTLGTPWYVTLARDDFTCGVSAGFWSALYDVPDYFPLASEGGGWSSFTVAWDGVSMKDYLHIVTHSLVAPPGYAMTYERCYFDDATPYPNLICQTYVNNVAETYTIPPNTQGVPVMQQVGVMDNAAWVASHVTASPVSKRVAIVYDYPVGGDYAYPWGTDVVYVESMNNGADWIAGTNWPPTRHNITNYDQPPAGSEIFRPAWESSACYDYEDSLHIVWITHLVVVPTGGSYYPQYTEVKHWSQKDKISTMHVHECGLNVHHQNESASSKVSIAAKDPIYHPDEGVYLFSTWTQVDTLDISLGGYGNRDIFGCGSTDGGDTWAQVFNLTNTQTDSCDSGDCVSESYASLAENMYSGNLHIQYICDKDAGPWGWDNGVPTENEVYYLELEEWDITEVPKGTYRIDDPESWYRPPLKVKPGEDRDVSLTIFSTGNVDLHPAVTCIDPCVEAPGGLGAIPPGDSLPVTITLKGSNPACQNTFIDAIVTITTDEPDKKVSALPIQAVVGVEDYYECPREPETFDTLDNGVLKLYVNANCQEWFHWYDPVLDTTHEVGFQGGIIVATIVDGDTLVGRSMGANDHKTDAQDSLYIEQCEQDWEPPFWIIYTKDIFINDLNPPMNDKWFGWVISKQVKFFKPSAPPEYRNIVIKYVKVKRQGSPGWWPGVKDDPTDYGNTYIGIAMDIDCPWDTMGNQNGRNLAGYDGVNEIAYQIGWDVSGDHPEYNDFYCGMALAEETCDTVDYQVVAPFGAYNVRNDSFLYPQSPWGWNDDELYELAETPGVNIQDADTLYGLDRTQVFTALKIPAGSDRDAEYSFILVEAVAPTGLTELRTLIDLGRLAVAREKCHGIPAKCGDVYVDYVVDLGDLLYLIAYLYKGGPEPPCPFNRGDVSSDGVIDLGDVLYTIAYLYKGGPEPVCPGIWF